MMENTSAHRFITEDSSIQPWLLLKVDGLQYVVKSFFSKCEHSYEIVVYDGSGMNMWQEIVDAEMFKEKCKQFNPNIESSPSNLLGHVENSFEECRKSSSVKLTVEGEDVIHLQIKSKLKERIPFTWTFVCSKCENALVNGLVVGPLFAMVEELRRQQQKLCSIIIQKDKEIQDYKDQGHSTSRRHLTTAMFSQSAFLTGCVMEEEFQSSCISLPLAALTNTTTSQLYRNVMVNKQAHKKQNVVTAPAIPNTLFETVPVSVDRRQGNIPSWSGGARNPHSIIDDKLGEDVATCTQTTTAEVIVDKDEEKERREALQHRLEQDEKKNRKKKRKLNI